MKVVGQISTPEEKKEIEFIAKIFIVGNRARALGLKTHDTQTCQIKKRKQQMLTSLNTCSKRY